MASLIIHTKYLTKFPPESVAQLAGKPLFSVSVTDIGLDAESVEHNLEALFELAARWRAVLLL